MNFTPTNQYYILVKYHNEPLIALIDTGASRSLMSYSKTFSRSLKFINAIHLNGLSETVTCNYEIDVTITLLEEENNNVQASLSLIVVMDLDHGEDILLGMNFLERFPSYIITHSTLSLKWDQKFYNINRINQPISFIRQSIINRPVKLTYTPIFNFDREYIRKPFILEDCRTNYQIYDVESNSDSEEIDIEN